MFTLIAAMADLEREVTRERILAGLAHARRFGTKSGRPIGRPKKIFDRDKVLPVVEAALHDEKEYVREQAEVALEGLRETLGW